MATIIPGARSVFGDASLAVQEAVDAQRSDKWKMRLASALLLLRAVYHVLKTEDIKASPTHRVCICKWAKDILDNKSSYDLYWRFIVEDRNLIAKQYQFRAERKPAMFLASGKHMLANSRGQLLVTLPGALRITDGPFKGKMVANLLQDAVAWWEGELSKIEREIMGTSSASSSNNA